MINTPGKYLFSGLCLLLSTIAFSQHSTATYYQIDSSAIPPPVTTGSRLFSQSKISLELFGISYRKEVPIKSRWTNIFHASLQYSFLFSKGVSMPKYASSTFGMVSNGIRYYYRIWDETETRRQNVGSFVQLDLGISTPPLLKSAIHTPGMIYARPHWGKQFAAGNWGSMDFTAGLDVVLFDLSGGNAGGGVSPQFAFRIGYLLRSRGEKQKN